MDGYEKEESPYHGLWVNCLLIVGVPMVLFFIFLPMFREYQRGADELHVISARVLAGGVGVLFHLSLWIAGVFRESIHAVTRRVSEFFEDLSISIGFAARELEVRKIVGDHMAPNAASGAVMRKAGMVQTGIIPGKYEKLGQVYDAVCYELVTRAAVPLSANEYQKKAMVTLNPGLSKHDVLLNGVMGLCGEAGECIDIVKKHLHQGHELDREKLCKELGDVAWYLAETAHALDLSLEEILRGNLEKLKKRYPQGFDTQRSQHREQEA